MTPGRWIALAALVLAAVFAYAGGTYSQPNYRAIRREEAAARRQAAHLQHEIDSLRIFADSLEKNPMVQEREARERFGMVRPGELLFMISRDTTLPRP